MKPPLFGSMAHPTEFERARQYTAQDAMALFPVGEYPRSQAGFHYNDTFSFRYHEGVPPTQESPHLDATPLPTEKELKWIKDKRGMLRREHLCVDIVRAGGSRSVNTTCNCIINILFNDTPDIKEIRLLRKSNSGLKGLSNIPEGFGDDDAMQAWQADESRRVMDLLGNGVVGLSSMFELPPDKAYFGTKVWKMRLRHSSKTFPHMCFKGIDFFIPGVVTLYCSVLRKHEEKMPRLADAVSAPGQKIPPKSRKRKSASGQATSESGRPQGRKQSLGRTCFADQMKPLMFRIMVLRCLAWVPLQLGNGEYPTLCDGRAYEEDKRACLPYFARCSSSRLVPKNVKMCDFHNRFYGTNFTTKTYLYHYQPVVDAIKAVPASHFWIAGPSDIRGGRQSNHFYENGSIIGDVAFHFPNHQGGEETLRHINNICAFDLEKRVIQNCHETIPFLERAALAFESRHSIVLGPQGGTLGRVSGAPDIRFDESEVESRHGLKEMFLHEDTALVNHTLKEGILDRLVKHGYITPGHRAVTTRAFVVKNQTRLIGGFNNRKSATGLFRKVEAQAPYLDGTLCEIMEMLSHPHRNMVNLFFPLDVEGCFMLYWTEDPAAENCGESRLAYIAYGRCLLLPVTVCYAYGLNTVLGGNKILQVQVFMSDDAGAQHPNLSESYHYVVTPAESRGGAYATATILPSVQQQRDLGLATIMHNPDQAGEEKLQIWSKVFLL